MRTAVEIYKLLPRTNCGTCGTSSCFGFAAKLATGQTSTDACPTMSHEARDMLRAMEASGQPTRGTVFEQTLALLKPKLRSLDFPKTARQFGAQLLSPDTLGITLLNNIYTISREGVVDPSGNEPAPWISILICNHLCMPDPPLPAGEWITFSSIPASHAKDKAWLGHVEDIIATRFSGAVDALRAACEKQGGKPSLVAGKHDAAYEFRLFPHYPVLLLFYDAVPDEDFPAQCKMLLDRTAPSYLDIESIVVLGEEFAGRLTA